MGYPCKAGVGRVVGSVAHPEYSYQKEAIVVHCRMGSDGCGIGRESDSGGGTDQSVIGETLRTTSER
jgi:hypothetical protein